MLHATKATLRTVLLASGALVLGAAFAPSFADGGFVPGTLVVSRVHFVPDTTPRPEGFPQIFSDPNVSGIQGTIFLDSFRTRPFSSRVASLALTAASMAQNQPVITTSFSSKSEGS